jgi:threonine dehydrogenase-like Zn-dependent dehydrogenase
MAMKAVVGEPGNKVTIWNNVPEPTPGPYEARIKVLAASICNSTDQKILHGEFVGPLPAILGHEAVGRVVEVGSKTRLYKVGDLVTRPRVGAFPAIGLGCAFGSFVEYGLALDVQAQAEDQGKTLAFVPDQTVATPDWDPMTLTQCITLKETLSFLRNWGVGPGHTLLIYGSGPVGVSFSLWGRYLGCDKVIVVGRRDEACRKAIDFGRATHCINNARQRVPQAVREITGAGVTHAIEAIGENAILQDCLDSLAPGGQVGVYGVPPASQGRSPLMDDPRISPVEASEGTADREVLPLVKAGKIPGREFVSHTMHFTEAAKGFELLASKKAFKVGLVFE